MSHPTQPAPHDADNTGGTLKPWTPPTFEQTPLNSAQSGFAPNGPFPDASQSYPS